MKMDKGFNYREHAIVPINLALSGILLVQFCYMLDYFGGFSLGWVLEFILIFILAGIGGFSFHSKNVNSHLCFMVGSIAFLFWSWI
jgi:hypothetical protein